MRTEGHESGPANFGGASVRRAFRTRVQRHRFRTAAMNAQKQLVGPLWGGGELELLLDESPIHLRALARLRPGAGVDLDLGLAMAPIAMSNDPTLQVVAAVRKRWR